MHCDPTEHAHWTRRLIGKDDHVANASSGLEYVRAEEPRDIALRLIADDAEQLHANVPQANVDFAFRYRRRARQLLTLFNLDEYLQNFLKDEKSYAQTKLLNRQERYLSGGRVDVIIWFWADLWLGSNPQWKRYLVDHELTHIDVQMVHVRDRGG